MDFSEDQLKSLKDSDLIKIRAELIGCLDDDEISSGPSRTLEMAELLSPKIGDRLFEADNGHCDFSAAPTEETLMSVKSRLTVNFSKEKLEFASRIIQDLKAKTTPVAPVDGASVKPIETVTTTSSEAIPVASVETAATVSSEATPVVPVETAATVSSEPPPVAPVETTTPVEASVAKQFHKQPVKTINDNKISAPDTSVHLPDSGMAEWPRKMPNASMPNAPRTNATSTISTSSKDVSGVLSHNVNQHQPSGMTSSSSSGGKQGQSSPRPKPKYKPHYPGFWERLFGSVGRRMDEFFKALFGR